MDGPGLKPVENETTSLKTRTTAEGKKYTYRLTVLQQPLRARACGSGAKSSADRRPVDPPPIVDLKIYDGETEDGEDVTFCVNSSYFLFVTLEQTRFIANTRGAPQAQPTQPVLTGTPVAGMVYLDRPTPAGYFIFPDLSVRHEGNYRLAFNLYEQVKDAKDDDAGEPMAFNVEHFTHRIEVKSAPFHVYSAKKFPGLSESTPLSRLVAEQGCRVRIRRDVRMRRRDAAKGGKDWEAYEDETAEARARMTATPEATAYSPFPPPHGMMDPVARQRSNSIVSHHSLAGASRRSSFHEAGQSYHQHPYGAAPHTPQNAHPQQSVHGPGRSPTQQYAQPPFMSQQSTMQPPPPIYHPHTHQPPPFPLPVGHQGYYPEAHGMTQSQYAQSPSSYDPATQTPRTSVDYSRQASYESHRSSTQYGPPPPMPQSNITPPQPTYQSQDASRQAYSQQQPQPQPQPQQQQQQQQYPYSSYHQASYGSSDGYNARPTPAEPVHPPAQLIGAPTPYSARPLFRDKLPSLNTSLSMISNKQLEPASPEVSAPSSSSYSHAASDSHKRHFGQVFNDRHLSQPLRQGARPSTPARTHYSISGTNVPAADEDAEAEYDIYDSSIKMQYRRADGRHIMRNLPPHN